MKNFTVLLTLFICYNVQSQVGIGIPNPDASAVLELASTQKGFLPPRLTTAERDAIKQPAEGLTIFNITKNCLEWYNPLGWYNACGDNGVATVTQYVCNTDQAGIMLTGVSVSGVTQTITATVSIPGSYDISTTANGVTFRASGNFTSIGNHDVVLHATGTPIVAGDHDFTLNTSPNTCSFTRITNTGPSVVSQYDCNTAFSGTMTAGVAVTGVTQTITATVTQIGTYNIRASANGVIFSSMGVFSATGRQDVTLMAVGTPIASGVHNFTLNTSPNTCTFPRTIDPAGCGTVVGLAGKTWMACNLGATAPATAYNDSAQYGDLYQWGRGTDGHEKRNSATTTTTSSTDTPGHGNFITSTSYKIDWRTTVNNNLWQGVTGINNPCPAGFRIPTKLELENEFYASKITNRDTAFKSVLKLPTPAYREYSQGIISNGGNFGYYWSSTPYIFNGKIEGSYTVEISASNSRQLGSTRMNGSSIRCIRD